MIKVKESELIKAGSEGMDEFIRVFTSAYEKQMEDEFMMEELNAYQHTLLAYSYFINEIVEGGFCQLIQNGYGPYIFDNPFAKMMRIWGLKDFSKLIYKAKTIYDEHKEDLVKERNEEEFMAMYEQYEAFDDIEEEFMETEEMITMLIASFVEENMNEFAEVIKD